MIRIHQFAPAKLNLYLHVTGRQADGYHHLDSLVGFVTIGDEVDLTPADAFSFTVAGPQAAMLAHEDSEKNLAVQAARSLAELTGRKLDAAITLTKKLPVASGIGGGSSDAAATLRALAQHWGLDKNDPLIAQAAARHGQDVPVCLTIGNTYMTANGVMPAAALPRAPVVLVNPGRGLPTPAVYHRFREGGYGFSPLARLTQTPPDLNELVAELAQRRNDLTQAACDLMPEIADILAALKNSGGCHLARMSGSGATCFGIFENDDAAVAASVRLRAAHPNWWIEAGAVNA